MRNRLPVIFFYTSSSNAHNFLLLFLTNLKMKFNSKCSFQKKWVDISDQILISLSILLILRSKNYSLPNWLIILSYYIKNSYSTTSSISNEK